MKATDKMKITALNATYTVYGLDEERRLPSSAMEKTVEVPEHVSWENNDRKFSSTMCSREKDRGQRRQLSRIPKAHDDLHARAWAVRREKQAQTPGVGASYWRTR